MKTLVLAVILFFPCAGFAQTVLVSPAASYGTAIPDNIKECALEQLQSEAVVKELNAAGITAQAGSSDAVPAKGRYLQLKIESAISGGNAFTGHRKQVTTSAKLFKNGKEVAQTTKSRDSSGGMWAGYKGSCSVLRRCVTVLGKDIAAWAKTQP